MDLLARLEAVARAAVEEPHARLSYRCVETRASAEEAKLATVREAPRHALGAECGGRVLPVPAAALAVDEDAGETGDDVGAPKACDVDEDDVVEDEQGSGERAKHCKPGRQRRLCSRRGMQTPPAIGLVVLIRTAAPVCRRTPPITFSGARMTFAGAI